MISNSGLAALDSDKASICLYSRE